MQTQERTRNRLLIISNNSLSQTNNNGKTLASFVEGMENVYQLYFTAENPEILGPSYFQLTDIDILRGRFFPTKRGSCKQGICMSAQAEVAHTQSSGIPINSFSRMLRDLMWWKGWKSEQLLRWLDAAKPDTIFFVAGDNGFAYAIVKWIADRYQARLVTYITDDYIMPVTSERIVERLWRKRIRKKMLNCIEHSCTYFTISPTMQKAYDKLVGRPSTCLFNMTPSLYDETARTREDSDILVVYAGSLYYGRDDVLGRLADASIRYNMETRHARKIRISIYTNGEPGMKSRKKFERSECCSWKGSLTPEALKRAYNQADVLLFVESFAKRMRDKTRFSLSTKVPEYMSVCKPIFAIGPSEVGSMEYLKDVAFCVTNESDIEDGLSNMLSNRSNMLRISDAAYKKYINCHNAQVQRREFLSALFQTVGKS